MKRVILAAKETKKSIAYKIAEDIVSAVYEQSIYELCNNISQVVPDIDTEPIQDCIKKIITQIWANYEIKLLDRNSVYEPHEYSDQTKKSMEDMLTIDGVAIYDDEMILGLVTQFYDWYSGRYFAIYTDGKAVIEKATSADYKRRNRIAIVSPYGVY